MLTRSYFRFKSVHQHVGLQARLQGYHGHVRQERQLFSRRSPLLLDLYSVAQMQQSWRTPSPDGSAARLLPFHLQGDCEGFVPRSTFTQPELVCGVNTKITLRFICFPSAFLYLHQIMALLLIGCFTVIHVQHNLD